MKKLIAYRLSLIASPGWTLVELLIVVAIIALILVVLPLGWRIQVTRGYDVKRKSDLGFIKRAFEEYYNDHGCFPDSNILNNCAGNQLAPYLPKIPCDPQTKTPYLYKPVDDNPCTGYRLCAALKDLTDPDITRLGCHAVQGCGWGVEYNYCLTSGVSVVAPGFVPGPGKTPTPTAAPTPTPPGPQYACAPGGLCNSYADPQRSGCPIWFSETNCQNQCGNPANWCAQ